MSSALAYGGLVPGTGSLNCHWQKGAVLDIFPVFYSDGVKKSSAQGFCSHRHTIFYYY